MRRVGDYVALLIGAWLIVAMFASLVEGMMNEPIAYDFGPSGKPGQYKGHAHLFRLVPPYVHEDWDDTIEVHEFVVVSAADVPFSGPETYIFPADSEGNVTDWGELPGSYRGGLSHGDALNNMGYIVVRSLESLPALKAI